MPQGVRDSVGSAPPVKAAEQTTGLDTMGDVKMEKARRQEMVALRDADEQMADVLGVVYARGRETPSLLLNKGSMRRGSIAFFGMAPSRANRPAIQRGEVKSQLYLCRLKNGSG